MKGEMLVKEWDICITEITNCHEDITLSHRWKQLQPDRAVSEIVF